MAVRTGKVLAEGVLRPIHFLHDNHAFAPLGRRFHGIRQTGLHAVLHDETVNDNFDGMFLILLQLDRLVKSAHIAIHANADKAFLAQSFQ